jgi:hypothetical protein
MMQREALPQIPIKKVLRSLTPVSRQPSAPFRSKSVG